MNYLLLGGPIGYAIGTFNLSILCLSPAKLGLTNQAIMNIDNNCSYNMGKENEFIQDIFDWGLFGWVIFAFVSLCELYAM